MRELSDVGTVLSFATAGLLLLVGALSVVRRRALHNVLFAGAALLLATLEVADRLVLSSDGAPLVSKGTAVLFESLLPLVFLLLSQAYIRESPFRGLAPWKWLLLAGAAVFPVVALVFPQGDFFYAPDFASEQMLFLGTVGYWFYLGIMLYCVIALVNLETAFSATAGAARWKLKFDFIGLASLIAVLIFYYSQGLLYRTINMGLVPVRSGIFIVAAGLIGYSKLWRGDDTRVRVSRFVLYRSLALMVVGGYLLTLGLVGEGMKYFGTSFGRNAVLFIAFASGIFVFSLLFSEQFRRKIKVVVNKHFYAQKHDYRDAWLTFTGRLASCRSLSEVGGTTLTVYRELFGLKGASLFLFDKGRGLYRLAENQEMPGDGAELRLSPELWSYFVERNRVLNLEGAEFVPAEEERALFGRLHASLAIPLIANEQVVGIVLLGEQLSHEEFIFEDYDLMKAIARQAALSLANFQLSEELVEAKELAAAARVSSFIIHDLKNLSYSLSLLLENAEEYMDNPEFQTDMLSAVRNTVTRMKNLMQKLKGAPEKEMLTIELVDIGVLAADTVEEVQRLKRGLKIRYYGTGALAAIDREEMKKVALNLLLNATDAVAADGEIRVETGCADGAAYLRVADRGCGMSAHFMSTCLFKPFRSTKKKGLGIGLYHCKQIVEAHDGKIEVQSQEGEGSVFTVYVPAAEGAAERGEG